MNIKKIIPAVVLSGAALALTACGSSPVPNSSGSLSKFCTDQLSTGQNMIARLENVEVPSADDYHAVEGDLRKLLAEAPATVRPDLRAMADAAKQARDTGSGFIDSDDISAAADRINSFIETNCP